MKSVAFVWIYTHTHTYIKIKWINIIYILKKNVTLTHPSERVSTRNFLNSGTRREKASSSSENFQPQLKAGRGCLQLSVYFSFPSLEKAVSVGPSWSDHSYPLPWLNRLRSRSSAFPLSKLHSYHAVGNREALEESVTQNGSELWR